MAAKNRTKTRLTLIVSIFRLNRQFFQTALKKTIVEGTPNFSHTNAASSTSQQNATSPNPTTSSSGSNFNQHPINIEPRNSPSVSQMETSAPVQPPRCIVTDTSVESDSNDVNMGLTDTHDCLEIEDDPDDPDWEIVTPPAEPLPQGFFLNKYINF